MISFQGIHEIKATVLRALRSELHSEPQGESADEGTFRFLGDLIAIPEDLVLSLAKLLHAQPSREQLAAVIDFLEALPVGVDLTAATSAWQRLQSNCPPNELREFKLDLLKTLVRKSATASSEQLEATRA